jgi:hypothetical protein
MCRFAVSNVQVRGVESDAIPVIGFKSHSETPRKRYASDPKTRARELVEDGKIGGPRPGSGPRRKKHPDSQSVRASSVIAEELREHSDLAASVIPDVLRDPNASDRLKLAAIKLGLKIESDQADHDRQDEREGRRSLDLPDADADRDELASGLAAKLAANPIVARRIAALLSAVEA